MVGVGDVAYTFVGKRPVGLQIKGFHVCLYFGKTGQCVGNVARSINDRTPY